VEGHDERRSPSERARGPAAEAVVSVNDVEAVGPVPAPQLASRGQVVHAARLEREQLEVHAVDPAQSLHLVGYETAALGVLGRGVEARDDENPHGECSLRPAPVSARIRDTRVWTRNAGERSIASPRRPRRSKMHRAFGYLHARLLTLRNETGQGTVEYVALILLVALVMAGVIAAMKGFKTSQGQDLGDAILSKIRSAVDKVEF
jgi:Flp pilus assembly pilin Flp